MHCTNAIVLTLLLLNIEMTVPIRMSTLKGRGEIDAVSLQLLHIKCFIIIIIFVIACITSS